jgi:hypothetical protein
MAIVTDTLEGVINGAIWYHFDIADDVLYLRRADQRDAATVAEETPEGLLLLRREDDDRPVGVTIINWWKRFGHGALPDSLTALQRSIEPWADRVNDTA